MKIEKYEAIIKANKLSKMTRWLSGIYRKLMLLRKQQRKESKRKMTQKARYIMGMRIGNTVLTKAKRIDWLISIGALPDKTKGL